MNHRAVDFDVAVNFDIQLTVDITKISVFAFATWLVNKSRTMKGDHHININGKQISPNNSEAIDFVTKEIECEQSNQDQ